MGGENVDEALQISVNKWDGGAVKNALDDAAKELIRDFYDIIESYSILDGRLAISTVAVIIAFLAVAYDFMYPYPLSKTVLMVCVIGYFCLTSILSAYIIFVEKNIFFTGLEKDKTGFDPDNKWNLSSHLKRHDDQYLLKLSITDGKSKATYTTSMERSVADFIDVKGNVRIDLYSDAIKALCDKIEDSKKQK